MDRKASNEHEHIGMPSVYSCPECGGVLWEIQDHGLLRFRCRVGHAFTSETMLAQQDEALEEALWTALKTLEESASFTQRMIQQADQRGNKRLGRSLEEKLHQTEQRITVLMSVFHKKEEDTAKERPA